MAEERFKKAVYMVRNGPARESSNEEKLKVYGLYKQATEGNSALGVRSNHLGDNSASQPWAVQMEARAKWDAHEANKGKSKEQAMQEYAALLDSTSPGWEDSETMKNYS